MYSKSSRIESQQIFSDFSDRDQTLQLSFLCSREQSFRESEPANLWFPRVLWFGALSLLHSCYSVFKDPLAVRVPLFGGASSARCILSHLESKVNRFFLTFPIGIKLSNYLFSALASSLFVSLNPRISGSPEFFGSEPYLCFIPAIQFSKTHSPSASPFLEGPRQRDVF